MEYEWNIGNTTGIMMGIIPSTISGWWFGTWLDYDFPYIGNVIIPTDFHIVQRGRYTTMSTIYHIGFGVVTGLLKIDVFEGVAQGH